MRSTQYFPGMLSLPAQRPIKQLRKTLSLAVASSVMLARKRERGGSQQKEAEAVPGTHREERG